MAHTENTIQNRKNKHLSSFERGEIYALHNARYSNREIARSLGRVHQTIQMNLNVEQRHNSRPEESPSPLITPKLGKRCMNATGKIVVQKVNF